MYPCQFRHIPFYHIDSNITVQTPILTQRLDCPEVPPSPPLLQLRGAKRRCLVLTPAKAGIRFASGSHRGLGDGGDLRFSAVRCRLGTTLVRSWFSDGGVETATASTSRNKSLRSRPCLVSVSSSAGEVSVRVESAVSGCPAAAWSLLLGSSVGGCSSSSQPGIVCGAMELCRGTVVGLLAARRVGRRSFLVAYRQSERTFGQRWSGCVPGRCASLISLCCGSCQSPCAMERLLALASISCLLSAPAVDLLAAVEDNGDEER